MMEQQSKKWNFSLEEHRLKGTRGWNWDHSVKHQNVETGSEEVQMLSDQQQLIRNCVNVVHSEMHLMEDEWQVSVGVIEYP
jgi:hypothetical protein